MIRLRLCAMTSMYLGLSALTGAAQQNEAAGEIQTKVVCISHIDARSVAQSLDKLEYPVRTTAPDPGRLILQGSPADIERTMELVQQLDVPGVAAGPGAESVQYIPLSPAHSKELMHMIETVAPSGFGTAYALDATNGMLVVRADDRTIQRVKELVKAVERPWPDLRIEFFFVRGNTESKQDGAGQTPAALKPVVDALQASGIGDLKAHPPIVVSARAGEDFHTESALILEGSQSLVKFFVEGEPRLAPGENRVHLQLNVSVNDERGRAFMTDTTVACKLDTFVVLAAAPATLGDSNALALAIRVTKSE